MSVKSPAKSDLIDRHEHIETAIEIGIRELERQPEGYKNGVLSHEVHELIRLFREDLEKPSNSEFMSTNDFTHYVKKRTREYILKIRNLKKKPEKDKKKSEHDAGTITALKRTQDGKNKTPVQKMVDVIEKNRQAQIDKGNTGLAAAPSQQALKNNPWLAFKAQQEAWKEQAKSPPPKPPGRLKRFGSAIRKKISRGGNTDRARESRPMRINTSGRTAKPAPPALPNKAPTNAMIAALAKNKAAQQGTGQQTKTSNNAPVNNFLAVLARNKAAQERTAQKNSPGNPQQKKPVVSQSTKVVIPQPKPSENTTKPPPFGPLKPFPIIPASDEDTVADFNEQPYIDVGDPEGRPYRGNPREYPQRRDTNSPQRPAWVPDQRPDDGDDDGGNHRRPPRRPKRRGGKVGGGGAKTAAQLAKMARTAAMVARVGVLLANPYVLGGLALLLILLIIIWAIGGFDTAEQEKARAGAQLTITKTGPPTGAANTEITYDIKADYPGTAQDVVIRDTLPPGVEYAPKDCSAAKYDPATRTVTWSAREILTIRGQAPGGTINNVNMAIKLTVRVLPEADNQHIINQAEGEVIGAQDGDAPGGPANQKYVPPAPPDSCGGKYASYIARNYLLPMNYGDPECNFDKDELRKLIEQEERGNQEFTNLWFITIIPHESGFNPNAWNAPDDASQAGLDPQGAWGLYQKGSSKPPGSPPPAGGLGGPLDRGDVNWETQTRNAIQANRDAGCDFWYYGTYRTSRFGAGGRVDRC